VSVKPVAIQFNGIRYTFLRVRLCITTNTHQVSCKSRSLTVNPSTTVIHTIDTDDSYSYLTRIASTQQALLNKVHYSQCVYMTDLYSGVTRLHYSRES